MAITVSSTQSVTAVERSSQSSAAGVSSENRTTAAGAQAEQRTAQNTRILEASLQVSIQSGNNSQALLFRSAIDKINELLAPAKGVDALQSAMGEDNSAEATAGRILSLSTGFFDSYAAQNPGKDPETLVKDFVGLIRSGFEQGYQEAADILKGLGVLGGEVESGIQKTFELVQKGLDDFLSTRLAALQAPADTAEKTSAAQTTTTGATAR
ncbi:MAG: DUF5610 domain-containing protein [Azoarcus sp.]|nr:DUF5610 domain-containing protein [Azoarcus sp.]